MLKALGCAAAWLILLELVRLISHKFVWFILLEFKRLIVTADYFSTTRDTC